MPFGRYKVMETTGLALCIVASFDDGHHTIFDKIDDSILVTTRFNIVLTSIGHKTSYVSDITKVVDVSG